MRGLTLFKSAYKKGPVSIGQTRHYSSNHRDAHVDDLLLLMALGGLGVSGFGYAANFIYDAIEGSFKNERQKVVSNDFNQDNEKLMAEVKKKKKKYPGHSISVAEKSSLEDKSNESNGFKVR